MDVVQKERVFFEVMKSDQQKLVQRARCALSLGVSVLSFWCFWCICRNAILPGSTAARELLILECGITAKVGEMRVVTVPGSTFGGDRERRLQVLVRAEGPTCVLSVTDLVVRTPAAHIQSRAHLRHRPGGCLVRSPHVFVISALLWWRRDFIQARLLRSSLSSFHDIVKSCESTRAGKK